MSNYPHLDIVAFFKPVILSLKICVYWAPEETATHLHKTLYRIYSISMFVFVFALYELGLIYKLSYSVGDLKKMIFESLLLVTNIGQLAKYYVTVTKNDHIQEMVRSTNGYHFQPKNKKHEEMITRCVKSGYHMTRLYLVLGVSTWLLWAIYPLVEKRVARSPIGIVVPFFPTESPYYEIQYFYEFFSVGVHVVANVNKDSIPVMLMSLIGGELDVLNDILVNLKTSALDSLKSVKELTEDIVSKKMEELLIECVDRHRTIYRLAYELNSTYTYAILTQFSVSVIIISLSLFQTTVLNLFTIEALAMIIYFVVMTVQLLCYCWYGNEIIIKSAKLFNSIYVMDWVETSIKFKKNLLFFMMRLQIPIKTYGGNFFSISLETYTAILRSSYTYYAVLTRVKNDV